MRSLITTLGTFLIAFNTLFAQITLTEKAADNNGKIVSRGKSVSVTIEGDWEYWKNSDTTDVEIKEEMVRRNIKTDEQQLHGYTSYLNRINGELYYGEFKEGKKNGIWIRKNSAGEIISKENYNNGELKD